jgi:hypothetical protein
MKKIILTFLSLLSVGCYTHPSDVGRVQSDSFENKVRAQEELIRRQQEVIKRQERELKDIERQRYYNDQYERFNPVE